MRLATFNVENLFDRARAMNLDSWDDGRVILERFAELQKLLGQVLYSPAEKTRMAELFVELGLEKSDTARFVILRRNRGKLLRRPDSGGVEVIANGRADWVGSLELRDEPVNERSMQNTARVMSDLGADVLGVIEAESRPVLADFNADVVPALGGAPFRHVMLIDGNDDRGIDVGLMTRDGYPIGQMRSHVDDRDSKGNAVFSRDCPEFRITTPAGNTLTLLINHFKSKGFGSTAASNARRKAQAARVAEIVAGLQANGSEDIAVIGDFNDTPASAPLAPLIDGSNLKDVFTLPGFDDGGHPGTFGLCNASNKIDYILLSPSLAARMQGGGVFRTGMWPGVRPRRWDCYPEIKRQVEAASDHAAVWVDLDF